MSISSQKLVGYLFIANKYHNPLTFTSVPLRLENEVI